jgi:hypothetical protein
VHWSEQGHPSDSSKIEWCTESSPRC